MIFILKWLKEWHEIQNELRERIRESNHCESCETLKFQLAVANDEKEKLLNRILEKPVETTQKEVQDFKPLMPNRLSWNARRQMLEAEDRAKAKVLRDNVSTNNDLKSNSMNEFKNTLTAKRELSISEIERELGVIS